MTFEASPGQNATILLVDDDRNLVLLVKDYLEMQGYRVLTAAHGNEGLAILRQHTPDLIICDVMMPQMDGYSFVSAVRQQTHLSWLPVLFLSAKGQTHDRIKGLQTGGDVYLVKPFEPDELLAQIQALLKQTARLREAQGRQAPPRPTPPPGVELTPTETRILQYVARGMSNREISAELHVSQRTVESHVSNMLGKTGCHNRTELARWAIDYHYV
ncbi:MAG: DNA-binding response regulator [Thermosynechococcus sp.]|uniref:response regulator transcription factor n=1 Tax=Thermosynechococcus sp. TaxID=2814275 RepID=UPI0021FD2853|nr:response regulator transcription factor [Thermosynechococcus sp.]BCX12326.1 MAG: DNA-binding response regulator [Thermosynechococcus sp.]